MAYHETALREYTFVFLASEKFYNTVHFSSKVKYNVMNATFFFHLRKSCSNYGFLMIINVRAGRVLQNLVS